MTVLNIYGPSLRNAFFLSFVTSIPVPILTVSHLKFVTPSPVEIPVTKFVIESGFTSGKDA